MGRAAAPPWELPARRPATGTPGPADSGPLRHPTSALMLKIPSDLYEAIPARQQQQSFGAQDESRDRIPFDIEL